MSIKETKIGCCEKKEIMNYINGLESSISDDYAKKTDLPDMTNYYTKTEIDTLLQGYQPITPDTPDTPDNN